MSVKAILDIDVNDAKFAAFKAQFDKYHAALSKQSEMWTKAGKSQTQIASHWQQLTAKMMAQQNAKKETSDEGKKAITNLRQSDSLWTSMSKNTKDVAKNIAGATTSLLRWTGILGAVSGLFGAGGLYGINRMAASASSQRQSAMGRGLSVGELSAFNTDFGRIFGGNADPFLSNVNEMMSDPRKSWGLMGVNNNGKTEDVAVNLLLRMRQRARSTDDRNLGMLDTQTGVGAGTQVWRTLHDMSDKEFNAQIAKNRADVARLNVPDPTLKAWQDFTDQMHRAGQQLENVFIKGLVKLSGPLGDLSQAAVKTMTTLMSKDGIIEQGIGHLAKWIEGLAKSMSSNDFQNALAKFTGSITDLSDLIHHVAHPFESVGSSVADKALALKEWLQPTRGGVTSSIGAYNRYLGRKDFAYGFPAGLLEAMKKAESGSSLYPAISKKGAIGTFQFMPDTAKQYGFDPFDPVASANHAPDYIRDLLKKYGGDVKEALAAYNYGPGNLDRVLAAHPTDWQNFVPAETRNYANKISLEINNNTGGSAVAVLNAQQ
jgi:hypothetical protein